MTRKRTNVMLYINAESFPLVIEQQPGASLTGPDVCWVRQLEVLARGGSRGAEKGANLAASRRDGTDG
jgi:hypothetical protein